MTTTTYIDNITGGILTLVKENPVLADESTLTADQYFVLMIYVTSNTYTRNYREYRGSVNYNLTYKTYDLDIYKSSSDYGYCITKKFVKLKNLNKGRIIIVEAPDITNCINMDE